MQMFASDLQSNMSGSRTQNCDLRKTTQLAFAYTGAFPSPFPVGTAQPNLKLRAAGEGAVLAQELLWGEV